MQERILVRGAPLGLVAVVAFVLGSGPASAAPPPPTPQQAAALETLQREADTYDQSAREYRDTVTSVIKVHYDEKKRTVLSSLDREIAIEKEGLCRARETAIARLEDFVCTQAGSDASTPAPAAVACKAHDAIPARAACTAPYLANPPDPETPNAMYRLAALYEERARAADAPDDVSLGLKPAIALYKRIIHQFPKYGELAAIYYYLGHAYNDSSRVEEAQQVWRSLVCHNKYPYPTPPDPKHPEVDSIVPMAQDATPARNAGTTFVDPFPGDCEMVAQPGLRPGEDPRYVAEAWWQIGNWEFDGQDVRAGVWNLNRAASAYSRSLQYKKPPLYSVALYKRAWTFFKQQRYEAATREFVSLLLHTDDLERAGNANVSDFRTEAYTYIAGSLTNLDFVGPAPDAPYVQRPDITDDPRFADPDKAEAALRVAIDRVKDPTLIPQDRAWTIEIYKALAAELRGLNQFHNAIDVYETALKKWPMHPTAPDVQNEIALSYDQLVATGKRSEAERDALAAKALEARTALASYVGNTPWVDANKENPAAIHDAERLVKSGLRQAAATHTNNGRQLVARAAQASDEEAMLDLSRAVAEYKLAALGWDGYLRQEEKDNTSDVYDSRFWLADAHNKQVTIGKVLHEKKADVYAEPSPSAIETAKMKAIESRDSNEDDRYLEVAAQMVVEDADVLVGLDYDRYKASKGALGYPKRTELEMAGSSVKRAPIPPNVLAAMKTRDEYVARVPADKDASNEQGVKNATVFEYDVADIYFVYGDFASATPRFKQIYDAHCGKDDVGQSAWVKLMSIATKSNDTRRAVELANTPCNAMRACATKADCGKDEECDGSVCKNSLAVSVTIAARYEAANQKFVEACGRDLSPSNPGAACDAVTSDRVALWKEAARLYDDALRAGPDCHEAPQGTMRAAFSFKQVGDVASAIKAYDRFIAAYGKEETLRALQKGDEAAYRERVGFLARAYDELGTTYYGFLDYAKAAETYEKIAKTTRFPDDKRKDAAENAVILLGAQGEQDRMLQMARIATSLHPTEAEKAKLDYQVASYDYARAGSDPKARALAQRSLAAFYAANKANPAAAKYALEASWRVAKMMQGVSDPEHRTWFANAKSAWAILDAQGAGKADRESGQTPYADYGAEAEYTLLDEEIHDKFDNDTGHHAYASENVDDILGDYARDFVIAQDYDRKLQHVSSTYRSLELVPAALARRGSLYDSLRSALYSCAGAAFAPNVVPKKIQPLLAQMRASGSAALVTKAQDIEDKLKDAWRNRRALEMESLDRAMVSDYAQAVDLARTYNVRTPPVTRAIARLASFTDSATELGEGPKPCLAPGGGQCGLGPFVNATPDPIHAGTTLAYTPQMYVQMRPALPAVLPPSGTSTPRPSPN